LAAGGGLSWKLNAEDSAAYDAAVQETWRHSRDFDAPPPQAQRELVRYATLAANSHNTQPWRFRSSERSISVVPDLARRLAVVDPDDHHLFCSLGCATENLHLAAAAFGLHATSRFDPSAQSISVDLDKAPAARSPLFEAIPKRQSTRGVFDGRGVPAEHIKLLEAAGTEDGMEMRLFTERKPIEDILGYLLAGDRAQMDDPAFIRELKRWLRFNYSEALAKDDGLFTKSTGNPMLPSWLGRAIFRFVVTKQGERDTYTTQIRSSAGVAVFISDKNEPASWSAAGRCCQRFALQATALGIRHCFINQPVEVPAVRVQFATYLGIGDRRPDLVMRFGYGPELPRSLRRPLDRVIVS
jgi:nitroreductase